MLHSHFHSCFQCMWHTLSHLRGCIWNRIGYLHGKCICALRSTTINILNIFFPLHSLLVFFLPAFFLFYLCFMLFRLHCFLPSVVVYRSASVSFYYYSIYYSIVDQEHLKKNSLFALVAEILLYIGHRKGKSKNIDKFYQKQEGIICNI